MLFRLEKRVRIEGNTIQQRGTLAQPGSLREWQVSGKRGGRGCTLTLPHCEAYCPAPSSFIHLPQSVGVLASALLVMRHL